MSGTGGMYHQVAAPGTRPEWLVGLLVKPQHARKPQRARSLRVPGVRHRGSAAALWLQVGVLHRRRRG